MLDSMSESWSESSSSEGPQFSVVIATFNDGKVLSSAIESVLSQDLFGGYELIVIDGGSQDQTRDVLNHYSRRLAYWISEPDHGIYEAWNKGIAVAKGEWIAFLGADDALQPNALSSYAKFLSEHPGLDYVSARVSLKLPSGHVRVIGQPWQWKEFRHFMKTAHVASIHARHLFERHGFFSLDYSICADYEFFLRVGPALKAGFLAQDVACMAAGGVSQSSMRPLCQSRRIKISTGAVSRLSADFDFLVASSLWWLRRLFAWIMH